MHISPLPSSLHQWSQGPRTDPTSSNGHSTIGLSSSYAFVFSHMTCGRPWNFATFKYFCENILKMWCGFFLCKVCEKSESHSNSWKKGTKNCLFSAQTKRFSEHHIGIGTIFPSKFGNTDDPRIWVNSKNHVILLRFFGTQLPSTHLKPQKGWGYPPHGALVSDSKKIKLPLLRKWQLPTALPMSKSRDLININWIQFVKDSQYGLYQSI